MMVFVQLIFAATILLSAALMFTLEFMFAKMVLPRLGGSPSVWNTCLVFYQAALMAGYLYAHLSLKWLGPRRQSLLHIVLLCVACIGLPIGVAHGWTPPSESNPIPWLLMLLTVCVGLPFFCISASAPLLQAWFARCGGRAAKDPYFLYAASNLGSLAGLAAYPLLIEPRLPLAWQTRLWSAGYGLLTALFALCAAAVWIAGRRSAAVAEPAAPSAAEELARSEDVASLPAGFHAPVTLLRRLWWLALSLVPSALLMGVTAHLAVDMPSMPLLWAIPLGTVPALVHHGFRPLADLEVALAVADLPGRRTCRRGGHDLRGRAGNRRHRGRRRAALGGLFSHRAGVSRGDGRRPPGEQALDRILPLDVGRRRRRRPDLRLVAPLVFNSVLEYPLMLVAACLLRPLPRASRYERFWRWSDLVLMLIQVGVLAFAACAISKNALPAWPSIGVWSR